MGRKKYYCDYCQRLFNDDSRSRTLHLQSQSHIQLKEDHYRQFKEPKQIYEEEKVKKPCQTYRKDGFCRFGLSCRYSHLTPDELENLRRSSEECFETIPTVLPNSNLWWHSREKGDVNSETRWSHTISHVVDEGLPISIKPFNIIDFVNSDLTEWGT